MSECAPPGAVQDLAGQRPTVLTPERIDAILGDFRDWLLQIAASPEPAPTRQQEPPLDLYTLLGQFTALRHEVHLQTRALRAQQELSTESLRQYGVTLEKLEAAQTVPDTEANTDEENLLRPFLKHLVDARDALALAQPQVERVGETLQPLANELATTPLRDDPEVWNHDPVSVADEQPHSPGFFGRWFGKGSTQRTAGQASARRDHEQALRDRDQRLQQAAEAAARVQLAFDSIQTGYTMSLQRLERALDACGLEVMTCLGESFDPEFMEVVEVAWDTGRPANEVVEEVRPGYLWRGRVFRYAQVRVAKS